MFERILVATDLSDTSELIIKSLGPLRRHGAREAVILYCLNAYAPEPLTADMLKFVQPKLDRQLALASEAGFEAKVEVAIGSPAREVHRVAEARDASLIVIGSHGHSLAYQGAFGSTACTILHHARRPVLIMRIRNAERDGRKVNEVVPFEPAHHVLYATDFSDNAEHAFSSVRELARTGSKRFTLVHVQDKTRIGKHLEERLAEFNKIDTDRLERLKAQLVEDGTQDVSIELPYGSPVTEILRVARERAVSLIVMGNQGRGFISEVFLGSVSHNVAHHAPVPLLLIPALR
ncbi:MAG: universal stress protein [candidate division WOR-3 bacterium]